jgi:hypothetical protein
MSVRTTCSGSPNHVPFRKSLIFCALGVEPRSAFRFRRPDSRAVFVQIKSPDLSVAAQKLNANLNFSRRNCHHHAALRAIVFALNDEYAAGLYPLPQDADLRSQRADVQSVNEEIGRM